jgi:copper transport protein
VLTLTRLHRAVLGFVVSVLAAWLMQAAPAMSHASLNATSPADGAVVETAPSVLTLTFSEPVSPIALNLIRPDGSSTVLDTYELRDRTVEIAAPHDLPQGTHVLTWRVVSADGHPVGGSVVFSIGEVSNSVPVVEASADRTVTAGLLLTRLAIYIGLVLGIGGAAALAWLTPQSRAGANIAIAAALLGLSATALSAGFQGLDALGATSALFFERLTWVTGMTTSHGLTVIVMAIALLLALFSLRERTPRAAKALALCALIAGSGALALSGHASAAEPQWITRPSVFVHAAGITLWLGALVPLGLALRTDAVDAAPALERFSTLIPWIVGALVVAGVALAIIQVEHPAALLTTAYGRLLLAKLVLVFALLAVAAFNRFRLTQQAGAAQGTAPQAMARSIAAETLIMLVILSMAAGWRMTPPPRALAAAASQPVALHIHTAQAMADVTITPGRAGPVSVSAILMTGDFAPLGAKEVTFIFSNADIGIEPFRRQAENPGDGTWQANDVPLPLPGTWTVRLDILINDFEMTRIQADMAIGP